MNSIDILRLELFKLLFAPILSLPQNNINNQGQSQSQEKDPRSNHNNNIYNNVNPFSCPNYTIVDGVMIPNAKRTRRTKNTIQQEKNDTSSENNTNAKNNDNINDSGMKKNLM